MNLPKPDMADGLGNDYPPVAELDLYGLLPCMLKVPLETEFNRLMQEQGVSGACSFDWQDNLGLMQAITEGAGPDQLPPVMIWVGNGALFNRNFMQQHVLSGRYRSISEPTVNDVLAAHGLIDPRQNFTMLATDAVVLVADLKLVGDLPLPQRWSDFLEPEYADTLSLCGRHEAEGFSPPMLLAMQQSFGFDGLRRFARAVGGACHPAQMSKLAGRGKPDGFAFNAVPLFFAETISDREDVQIIWPEDGALAVPMTMLVKADAGERQQQMARYFTSLSAAEICSSAWFPALHPAVDNSHLPGRTLKWIGWDLLYDPSFEGLLAETLETFRQAFREKRTNTPAVQKRAASPKRRTTP